MWRVRRKRTRKMKWTLLDHVGLRFRISGCVDVGKGKGGGVFLGRTYEKDCTAI